MKARQKIRNAVRERRRFPERRTETGDAAWRLLRLAFYCVRSGQFAQVSGRLIYETR